MANILIIMEIPPVANHPQPPLCKHIMVKAVCYGICIIAQELKWRKSQIMSIVGNPVSENIHN